MDAKIIKLQEIEKRYLEINDLLMQEDNASDVKKYTKLSKEQASLRAAYEAYQNYKKYTAIVEDGQEMLKDPDPEIREMAETEISDAKENLEKLDKHIEELLLPRDPEDAYDCIVEIRGAAGGDEGNIFAGDLFRMYSYYAESLGYKVEVMESSEGEAGGYALISFQVKGLDAYRHFKFESGAHRVQRVPKTESAGRIHTSTATVLVLPEVDDVDYHINEEDLIFETHRSSGAGGQHINKTDSAVRITHIPTGITVNCQDGRSQIQNREQALKILTARVFDEYKRQEDAAKGEVRRSKIGTGDRSEKIRTYNYPQNRVTDHRINFTIQQLDRVMEGKLDDIIAALLEADQKAKIAGESN